MYQIYVIAGTSLINICVSTVVKSCSKYVVKRIKKFRDTGLEDIEEIEVEDDYNLVEKL